VWRAVQPQGEREKAMSREQLQAEQATGILENPHGVGKFYSRGGIELTVSEATDYIRNAGMVEVPNAGAGSYRKVFELLGFVEVKPYDLGSSAGDWAFVAFDGELWYIVAQHNRYPHYGFGYTMGQFGFDTDEKAMNWAACQ
jgi:hypothetical protein